MKLLYFLLHIGTFIMGWYDNGDITAFALLIVIDVCIILDKLFKLDAMYEKICDFIRKENVGK